MKNQRASAAVCFLMVGLHFGSLPILAIAQNRDFGDAVAAFLTLDDERVPRVLENDSVIMVHTKWYKLVAGIPYDAWFSSIYSMHCLVAIWISLGIRSLAKRIVLGVSVLAIQFAVLVCTDIYVLRNLDFISLWEEIEETSLLYLGIPMTIMVLLIFMKSRKSKLRVGNVPSRLTLFDVLAFVFAIAALLALGRLKDISFFRAIHHGVIMGLIACLAIWVSSPPRVSRWCMVTCLAIAFAHLPPIISSFSSQNISALLTVTITGASIAFARVFDVAFLAEL